MKRKNPYTTLLELFRSYVIKIKNRKDIHSFYYGIDKVKEKERYLLDDLFYKIQAANELGYDTVLKATNLGIEVHFVGKLPEPPYCVY